MKRKIHRILSIILALPLAWQIITGYILYYRYEDADKPRQWKDILVKLHNGEWMGAPVLIVGFIYCLVLLFFVTGGLLLVKDEKDKNNNK